MAFGSNTRGHTDFRRRVKRVDPGFHRWGQAGRVKDATVARPVVATLAGFAWAYVVISVGTNRATLESSLAQGSLSAQAQGYILMALAALLTVSVVMLLLHLARYFMVQGSKKRNSGSMLLGVLGALVLVYTPESVWQTGFDMMDGRAQGLLVTAQATVSDAIPGVDLGSVTFVSSAGR